MISRYDDIYILYWRVSCKERADNDENDSDVFLYFLRFAQNRG